MAVRDPVAQPLVIQTERLHPDSATWLAQRCTLVAAAPGEEAFEAHIERANALVVRTYTRVDASLLARAPRLRVVGRAGVGLDNIDLVACAERHVAVVHTPDANTTAVVEYVFTLLLDALRPRQRLLDAPDPSGWEALRKELSAPRQLADLTLGIYGLGRVGSAVARVAAAFHMRVLYHDLLDIPESRRHGATPVSRDTLLEDVDILSVHVDGRPENRRLLDGPALDRLRDDAILVNTSRGFIIDTPALASWLRRRPHCLALLDVHQPEPIPSDHPLLGLPNARLYPHLGGATATANRNMSRVVEDIWRVLSGEEPAYAAVRPAGAS